MGPRQPVTALEARGPVVAGAAMAAMVAMEAKCPVAAAMVAMEARCPVAAAMVAMVGTEGSRIHHA